MEGEGTNIPRLMTARTRSKYTVAAVGLTCSEGYVRNWLLCDDRSNIFPGETYFPCDLQSLTLLQIGQQRTPTLCNLGELTMTDTQQRSQIGERKSVGR